MKTIKISLFVCFLFFAGCSASGPKFSYSNAIKTDKTSTVYLFRAYNVIGSAGSPYIYLDKIRQGKMHTGGYMELKIPFGKKHNITIGALNNDRPNWAPGNVTFVFDAPVSEYFLRMDMDFSSVTPLIIPLGSGALVGTHGSAGITITELGKEAALAELAKTNLSQ